MPAMQALVERLNTRFNRDNIKDVDEKLLERGQQVSAAAGSSRSGETAIRASDPEQRYISNFPAAELEALRAALYKAVMQTPRLPVQFLWTPGDHYHVQTWEVAGTAASLGGISVLLSGPVPD